MTLGGILSLLASYSYSCWWEAEDGCVSPAGCHLDGVLTDPRMKNPWSNVVCVHARTAMFAAVSRLADECASASVPRKEPVPRRWQLIGKHDRGLIADAARVYRRYKTRTMASG